MTNNSPNHAISETMPSMPQRHLRGIEKLSVPLFAWLGKRPWARHLGFWYIRLVSRPWASSMIYNILDVRGLERIEHLNPSGSVILVANHRSFFDMHVASSVVVKHCPFVRFLCFPVRANFFYENPIGILLNLVISSGSMWPPLFRDKREGNLNQIALQQVQYTLKTRGAVVGIHPEGTRNKGSDPYSFLPPRHGIGQVVQDAPDQTIVVPFFICGLSNNLLYEAKRNFRRDPTKRGEKIRLTFGEPISVSALRQARTTDEIATLLMDRIALLGAEDKSRRLDTRPTPS